VRNAIGWALREQPGADNVGDACQLPHSGGGSRRPSSSAQ
jgi:hypothetical protein